MSDPNNAGLVGRIQGAMTEIEWILNLRDEFRRYERDLAAGKIKEEKQDVKVVQ